MGEIMYSGWMDGRIGWTGTGTATAQEAKSRRAVRVVVEEVPDCEKGSKSRAPQNYWLSVLEPPC